MKNANVGKKKTVKTTRTRRVAGMPVRSGLKAGRNQDFGSGIHDFGRPGRDLG